MRPLLRRRDRRCPAPCLVGIPGIRDERRLPSSCQGLRESVLDRVRLRSPKLRHAIQHVARESSFDFLGISAAGSKSITDDRLEPEERVLGAALAMEAGFLLPLSATNFRDPADGSITLRPSVPIGRGGSDVWDNHSRAAFDCRVVE